MIPILLSCLALAEVPEEYVPWEDLHRQFAFRMRERQGNESFLDEMIYHRRALVRAIVGVLCRPGGSVLDEGTEAAVYLAGVYRIEEALPFLQRLKVTHAGLATQEVAAEELTETGRLSWRTQMGSCPVLWAIGKIRSVSEESLLAGADAESLIEGSVRGVVTRPNQEAGDVELDQAAMFQGPADVLHAYWYIQSADQRRNAELIQLCGPENRPWVRATAMCLLGERRCAPVAGILIKYIDFYVKEVKELDPPEALHDPHIDAKLPPPYAPYDMRPAVEALKEIGAGAVKPIIEALKEEGDAGRRALLLEVLESALHPGVPVGLEALVDDVLTRAIRGELKAERRQNLEAARRAYKQADNR